MARRGGTTRVMFTPLSAILDTVTTLAERAEPASLAELADAVAEVQVSDADIEARVKVDPSKPYGRQVLLANERIEGMIARWTRGVPCFPHDHGGSFGAVRLLRGAAIHRTWRVTPTGLELTSEGRVEAPAVLSCGPHMVHSMVDAGAEEPLTTLHMYIDPIDHMMVYDIDGERTLMVDGGCGAWIPDDQPELVRAEKPGFHRHL